MEGATMIDILEGFPHSVLAFAATGGVTKKDYDDLLIPKLEEAPHLALVMHNDHNHRRRFHFLPVIIHQAICL